MAGIHALDRLIGNEYPELLTDEEVRVFEQVPYADRVAAESTYDAIKLGAARNPDGAAIQFLQNADLNYSDFFGLFHVPQFTSPDKAAADAFEDRHIFFAYVLLGLIAVHFVAALWHHFIRRDRVVARMVTDEVS